MASIDENNSSLDYIENRISTIKRIARKHNIEENQISNHMDDGIFLYCYRY